MSADRILLEVCVDTPAGLAAAIAGGADRIELCAALALQGLTPAPGLMAIAAQAPIPIYPMIRPRNGDFCYDAGDLDAMRRDIDAVRAYGLAGVVIGANLPDGQLDLEALELLVAHAQGLGVTLHRSFDLVPDQAVALETAIALGFERILTSGGALTAEAGAEAIAALVEQAAGRIAILAGAGVRPGNIADLVRRTGVREVHGSFGGPVPGADPDSQLGRMGFVPPTLRDTEQASVAEAVRILRGL
ncbi:copper homeostasis protein CutC [Caulobacter sp. RHG1]|uniref:copper homeostasis protein CutC n=1 Tax=Caulobacter sp. (strain RHG1) TaxID=2545762 RepID=UPI001553EAF4|nr:copper homeostasis protein CutC [Caulobacter sp. RHG1]NQE62643.1 Cytoplasmic copper homeostasis protein CutC [Caulobacter sp. RHG1]